MSVDNHRARKRFGQNFLHDPAVIQRIIAVINPQKQDHIIEIGPGKGALTKPLLANVNQLDIIEIDRDLVNSLPANLGFPEHLKIHQADALKFDFSSFNHTDLRIIGNLPYNISTPLLFHLLSHSSYIHDMVFMLQKEVVDRICATPGNKSYGRLSIMLQYFCDVESLFTIKPGSFNPSPKVDSAIVRLMPRNPEYTLTDHEAFSFIVKAAFSQRRKTIRNTLKNILNESQLIEIGIAPEIRAENLAVKDFVELANYYHHLKISSL